MDTDIFRAEGRLRQDGGPVARPDREAYISHILTMRKTDPDYARYALRTYAEQMPFLDLVSGVKAAMEKHE
jgi:hypothetical protein